MRAGLFLAYWPWFTPEEQVELAVLADELGLDSVWVSEAWGQDAVSVLGLLAGKTERVALGSGLFQIPARAPAATAMAAATLDVLSRRAASGSGSACRARRSPRAGTACRSRGRVSRTREYVEIVRTALARKTLVHEGREYRVPLDGAKPLKLLAKPVQERIPIYLGAVGPKAVEQVGEIADGWLPFMLDPRARRHAVRAARPRPREGGPHPRGHRHRGLHRDGRRGRPRRGARRRAPVAGVLPRRDGLARRRTSTSSSPSARATARRRASARRRSSAATASAPPAR